MKKNNAPTVRELTKWAKAAGIYKPSRRGTMLVHLEPMRWLTIKPMRSRDDEDAWRPDLYPSHAAPLVEALGISVMQVSDDSWISSPWQVPIALGGICLVPGARFPTYTAAVIAAVRARMEEPQ